MTVVRPPVALSPFSLFHRNMLHIWLVFSMIVLVFMLARSALLLKYFVGNDELVPAAEIVRMWWVGLKFDMRIAGMALAPAVLLSLCTLFSRRCQRLIYLCLPGYGVLLLLICGGMAIANQFYYQTYHNHFDVFVFALFDGDTGAVLINMWQGYPILLASVTLLGVTGLLAKGMGIGRRWLVRVNWQPGRAVACAYVLVSVLLIALAGRGSAGTFPLRQHDALVSQSKLLNAATPNSIIAMSWAAKAYRKSKVFPKVTPAQGQELLAEVFTTDRPSGAPWTALVRQSVSNPSIKQRPPHVVLSVMESMSNRMLDFHKPGEVDLLGALAPHLEQDFLYRRFFSGQNGTIASLAQLMVLSPEQGISQSTAQRTAFKLAMTQPYRQAGYKTVFVTAGNGGWRNLKAFALQQGFDDFYDKNAIKAAFPGAEEQLWGVTDEYAFRFAETLLSDADARNQPLFVVILSITNHPPYQLPKNYQLKPLKVPEALYGILAEDEEQAILSTYQYSNDQLGQFISRVKQQPLGRRTILAATGDHEIRALNYSSRWMVWDKSVPFYLHVPKAYLPGDAVYSPQRFGSHRDIMPTLYALSLSAAKHSALGRNLLQAQDEAELNFAYNGGGVMDERGYYDFHTEMFYPWRDEAKMTIESGLAPVEEAAQHYKRYSAYHQLWYWQLYDQVNSL